MFDFGARPRTSIRSDDLGASPLLCDFFAAGLEPVE
jgi:hypothetical protein